MVQDRAAFNLGAELGVAVYGFPFDSRFADYLLFVDRKVFNVLES